ncbi:MAG: hypothetical protein H7A01_06965 [Hahellaceae bacterium]|nr:hypothetical protein [Hahellaceae bacterium]MCP5211745.1 hypothetical protein [Hahellaceae bacterium]
MSNDEIMPAEAVKHTVARLTYPGGAFAVDEEVYLDRPFSAQSKAFISQLSHRLMESASGEFSNDLMALGFWFRDAAVNQLQAEQEKETQALLKPVGVVFQVAPGNVETLFLYCGLLSLLLGNFTLIRVSRRRNRLFDKLLGLLNELLSLPVFSSICQRWQLIDCDHSDPTIGQISAGCDLRILWGSDATIQALRQIPLKPSAKDLSFAARCSLAVISVAAVQQAVSDDSPTYQRLIEYFCRDAFSLKQQACTSCRAVVWILEGVDAQSCAAEVIERFWVDVCKYCLRHGINFAGVELVQRVTARQAMAIVCENDCQVLSGENVLFERLQVSELSSTLMAQHAGCGLFLETAIKDMCSFVLPDAMGVQTLGYWGLSKAQISAWLQDALKRAPMRAVPARTVPLGQMNQFERVWDGYDLCRELTCQMVIG